MAVQGFLELRDSLQICGWVYDPEQPTVHADIEILLHGQVIGRARADYYRKDLEAGGIGHGDHAFVFNATAPLDQSQLPHLVVHALLPNTHPRVLEMLVPDAPPPAMATPQIQLSYPGVSQDGLHRPVFILGAARSATSAMTRALLDSTRYKGQEEGHFLEVLAPLLVELHRFYDRKTDEAQPGQNTMVALAPERFLKDSFFHAFIIAARQLFPDGYWVEKTPSTNMIYLAPRFRQIWPNARFIFMKRRGIDNVASRLRKFPYDFAHNCREWAAAMQAWVGVRGELRGAALEVDQRMVAEDPTTVATNVAHLLSLKDVERLRLAQCLGAIRPQQTSHHSPSNPSLDKMGWPPDHVEMFTTLCGPMMAEFNYSMSSDPQKEEFSERGCVVI